MLLEFPHTKLVMDCGHPTTKPSKGDGHNFCHPLRAAHEKRSSRMSLKKSHWTLDEEAVLWGVIVEKSMSSGFAFVKKKTAWEEILCLFRYAKKRLEMSYERNVGAKITGFALPKKLSKQGMISL